MTAVAIALAVALAIALAIALLIELPIEFLMDLLSAFGNSIRNAMANAIANATANAMANAVTDHGTVAGRPKATGCLFHDFSLPFGSLLAPFGHLWRLISIFSLQRARGAIGILETFGKTACFARLA